MKEILFDITNYKDSRKTAVALCGDRAEVVSNNFSLGGGVNVKLDSCFIFPGFADVHVHLREPGFSYKETIKTGTLAAAHGGFTDICAMPNLNPVPDSPENLAVQTALIKSSAVINVHPYGALTVGERGEAMADLEGMAQSAVAFSDDGRGVQSEEMMLQAMKRAKALNKIIAAHCEVNELLNGGYIHAGDYAKRNGHPGIVSESEWRQIERDIRLAKKTGCAYHVCHISCRESVERIRRAKLDGVDVTCETAPHYLVLDDSMLKDEGRFKMNPPIRSLDDKNALIEGLADGTIDMIATDHAPHSAREKSGGLKGSLNGIVGLETSFPVLYTKLVKPGIISLQKLIELMAINPRRRFNIPLRPDDFTVFDLGADYVINTDEFLSMGRSTPFEGETVFGKCLLTVTGGNAVWQDSLTER